MNHTCLHLRKCVFCNAMKNKEDLFRVVKVGNNIFLDTSNKANGRGAYICKDCDCINSAMKKNSLSRSLKCKVDVEIYNSLFMELKNYNG